MSLWICLRGGGNLTRWKHRSVLTKLFRLHAKHRWQWPEVSGEVNWCDEPGTQGRLPQGSCFKQLVFANHLSSAVLIQQQQNETWGKKPGKSQCWTAEKGKTGRRDTGMIGIGVWGQSRSLTNMNKGLYPGRQDQAVICPCRVQTWPQSFIGQGKSMSYLSEPSCLGTKEGPGKSLSCCFR